MKRTMRQSWHSNERKRRKNRRKLQRIKRWWQSLL